MRFVIGVYGMPGTDAGYAANPAVLRSCYAVPGNDVGYAATPYYHQSLRICYAVPGTDVGTATRHRRSRAAAKRGRNPPSMMMILSSTKSNTRNWSLAPCEFDVDCRSVHSCFFFLSFSRCTHP
eukprot:492344-Rhodomonas_salina.1